MKALRLFCVGMMACLAVVACSDDDDDATSPEVVNPDNPDNPEGTEEPEEPTYEGEGKISSTSNFYTAISDLEGTLFMTADGGTATVTVEGETGWNVSCSNESDFAVSVDEASGSITVSADGNTDTGSKVAEVTITVTELVEVEDEDGVETEVETEVVFARVHVIVLGSAGEPFVLEYSIKNSNARITLPLANMDAMIAWADGSVEYCSTDYPSHTFATADDYDVEVYGVVKKICSYDVNSCVGDGGNSYDYTHESTNPNSTLVAVKSWGGISVEEAQYAFLYCTALKSLPETTGMTFYDNLMFEAAFSHTALEVIPADIFKQSYLPSSYRNEGLRNVFSYTNVVEIPEGLFDGVTCGCAECMFSNCLSLTTIPEALFDDCELDDFHRCFYNCRGLTELPPLLWAGNNNVANTIQTFAYCVNLEGESPYGYVDGAKIHLYERDKSHLNSKAGWPPAGGGCFLECYGLSDYYDMPDDWH